MWAAGQVVSGLVAMAVIVLLVIELRRARFAAVVGLDVARRALDHDEMGVDVAADLGMDEEEADEERDWISVQRSRLKNVRPLVGLPSELPKRLGDSQEAA